MRKYTINTFIADLMSFESIILQYIFNATLLSIKEIKSNLMKDI